MSRIDDMVAAAYAEARAPMPAVMPTPQAQATMDEKLMALSQMVEAGFIAGDPSYYSGDRLRNT